MSSIPDSVIAAGWIPFAVVLLLVVIFSWLYIAHFKSKHESEWSSTITAVLGLSLALFTLVLVPVDVFLISFMKDTNGTFKDWAVDQDVRTSLENSVLYTYYVLYISMLSFLFVVLPFIYFFYEERDEIATASERICSAFRYTIGFLLIAAVLVLMGSLVPLKEAPPANSTQWSKIEFLVGELGSSKGEDILSFVLSVLTVIGMSLLVVFAGYGMSALPCSLISGHRSVEFDLDEIRDRRVVLERRAADIRLKYEDHNRKMASRDQSRLFEIEEELRLLERQERHLTMANLSMFNKCFALLRPCEMVVGIALTLVGFLIFLSLLLTNIDKAMNSLGMKMGYQLVTRKLPNPIDIVFVYAEMVFPLDYVLFSGIVFFCFFCIMSALRRTGIWFLWIRMYRIRAKRTRPQGLLMMIMTLMLNILALNVLIYSITPQYMMFGSQQYWGEKTTGNGLELIPCSLDAPEGDCVMSQSSLLLIRYFYKAWIFGAIYYWATWFFLVVVILGSIVSTFKRRSSLLEDSVNRDDFDESDDEELLHV